MSEMRTIELTLMNGDFGGVVSAKSATLIMHSFPKKKEITDHLKKYCSGESGIYILYSSKALYVGQTKDLEKRIKDHLSKPFWERVLVFFPNTKDPLDSTSLDYLEDYFIERAEKIKSMKCQNAKSGNISNATPFQKNKLFPVIQDALFLMNLIGMKYFEFENYGLVERLKSGTRKKSEAIEYLKTKGINLSEAYVYYASNATNTSLFAADIHVEDVRNHEWYLICNDIATRHLIVLRIPAGIIKANGSENDGAHVRLDTNKVTQC